MPKRIDVKGVIIPNDYQWVYDWLEWEATSPKKVDEAIREANGDELEVIINSGGGDVYAGSEIYTLLKEYKGQVTVKIVGVAASAASVIAMAGKRVLISPTAQIMIHNVKSASIGDHRDHAHESRVLRGWDKSIANAYRLKTGLSEDELLKLMDQEKWLTAQEALKFGFVDEIMFDEEGTLQLVASAQTAQILPKQVVDKIRNELLKKKGEVQMDGLMNQTDPQVAQQQKVDSAPQAPANIPQTPANEPQAAAVTQTLDPAAQERERLRAIDEIAANIDPELVKEAKYGPNPMTAEQLALKALREGRMNNMGLFHAAMKANAAAGTNGVLPSNVPQNNEQEFDLSNAADLNKVLNALDVEAEKQWAIRLMGGR